MSWAPGDQAMCVKAFPEGRRSIEPRGPIPGGVPKPPLVYTVSRVIAPPDPPPGTRFEEPGPPPCYLELEGKGDFAFDCTYFRKLDPLPPDEIDLPAWMPAPTPETV